jgi:trehalose 6-phosphate phosphatase
MKMNSCNEEQIRQKIGRARHVWLFLDYDGTLADFAPTPEDIIPDPSLIALIKKLAGLNNTRVTIISGRRLAHIQALLPLRTVLMAGTYGLEIQTPDGEMVQRLDYGEIRPFLDELHQAWAQILVGRSGFFLEDKGWTLAIHAKDAAEVEAGSVLEEATRRANDLLAQAPAGPFRLQGGHRFLECSPLTADKKKSVNHILAAYPWYEDALLVYLGDDDKDEVAFSAIQERSGVAVAVGERLRSSTADCLLPSPQAARQWLQSIAEARNLALQ